MPVWMTKTGPHGSIQVFPDERVPLKTGGTKLIPGLRLTLQRAWVTGDIDMGTSAYPENPNADFSRLAPEFYDTDHMPPGDTINLRKAALHRDGWKREPKAALENWLSGDDAKQYYGFELSDPRGKRPVRMIMTADDYAKFEAMKNAGGIDVHEVVVSQPEAVSAAQKVHQGTRVTR